MEGSARSNTKLLDMVFNRLYHHMALKRMKMVSLTAMQYHQPFRVRFNVVDGSFIPCFRTLAMRRCQSSSVLCQSVPI